MKYTKEMFEEYRREQDEKAAKEERERRERWEEYNARRAYLLDGGIEEEFEEAWPEIKAEMLKQRTLEGDSKARVDFRRSMLSTF